MLSALLWRRAEAIILEWPRGYFLSSKLWNKYKVLLAWVFSDFASIRHCILTWSIPTGMHIM